MTLNREDLLKTKTIHRSKQYYPINGYIAFANTPNQKILKIIIFFEGTRLKGYIPKHQLQNLLDKENGIVKIHRKPKTTW